MYKAHNTNMYSLLVNQITCIVRLYIGDWMSCFIDTSEFAYFFHNIQTLKIYKISDQ